MGRHTDVDVLIARARPVDLTLAIDLGRRGVRCLVVERAPGPGALAKMERCNAHDGAVSPDGHRRPRPAAGLPTRVPMNVFIMTRLVDEAILRLVFVARRPPRADRHSQRRH
jgi:hypothetical protein